jgi:hypothetical protein
MDRDHVHYYTYIMVRTIDISVPNLQAPVRGPAVANTST